MLSKQQSSANASFECAKLCLANFLRTSKFALQYAIKGGTYSFFKLSRDETLVSRDESLVSRDEILVSREGGNLLLSGTVRVVDSL